MSANFKPQRTAAASRGFLAIAWLYYLSCRNKPSAETEVTWQGRSRRSGQSGHGLTTFSATIFLLFFAARGEIFSLKFTKYRSAAALPLTS